MWGPSGYRYSCSNAKISVFLCHFGESVVDFKELREPSGKDEGTVAQKPQSNRPDLLLKIDSNQVFHQEYWSI